MSRQTATHEVPPASTLDVSGASSRRRSNSERHDMLASDSDQTWIFHKSVDVLSGLRGFEVKLEALARSRRPSQKKTTPTGRHYLTGT